MNFIFPIYFTFLGRQRPKIDTERVKKEFMEKEEQQRRDREEARRQAEEQQRRDREEERRQAEERRFQQAINPANNADDAH